MKSEPRARRAAQDARRSLLGPAARAALLAAGAGFVLYAATLRFGFVWDDAIVLFQQLPFFHSLADVLVPPPDIVDFQGAYYRPVVTLSYLLDRSVWGTGPFGFHFSVVLVHALNAALVTLLALRLFGDGREGRQGALAAGVIFAAHPIHTESVAWIAGRSDPLATACVLMACLLWFRPGRSGASTVTAAALLLLGTLAKETAIGMAAVLFVGDRLGIAGSGLDSKSPKPASRGNAPPGGSSDSPAGAGLVRLVPWIALVSVLVVFVAMRRLGLSGYQDPIALRAGAFDPLAPVRGLGFYLIRLLVPVGLDIYIPSIPYPALSLLAGLAAIVLSVVVLLLALRRGETRGPFYLAWFYATLAPAIAPLVFDVGQAPIAERYLYLPSISLCLAIGDWLFVRPPALLGSKEAQRQGRATIAAGAFVLGMSALTLSQVQTWRSDIDLWEQAVAVSPDEGFPHLMLGGAYDAVDRLDEARSHYTLAIEHGLRADLLDGAWNGLGMIEADLGALDRADEDFRKAIAHDERQAQPRYGLGLTATRRAEKAIGARDTEAARTWLGKAEQLLKEALDLNPNYAKAQAQLARVLHLQGRNDEALAYIAMVERSGAGGRDWELAESTKQLILAPPAH